MTPCWPALFQETPGCFKLFLKNVMILELLEVFPSASSIKIYVETFTV